jgi:hypothetical protein
MYPVPQPDGSDPNVALQLIGQRAQMLTRSTGAAIALGHKESMICLASVGANAPTLGTHLDVSTGFSGECVRTAKALRCDNSDSDSRVDAETCRQLGVRSILAAPIMFAGEVVGLLETFSSQRFAFHEGDLVVLENLAETILEIRSSFKAISTPNLLFKLEPAYRVFLGNLIDILRPPQGQNLKLTSLPGRFWPDVFVSSQLPWQRFRQSMLLHLIMVVALGGFLEFGISRPQLRQNQPRFDKAHVIYYSPADYLSSFKRDTGPSRSSQTQRPALVKQPVISLPRESGRRATSITPPNLKLKQELQLARIMAWNSAIPTAPFMATTGSQRTMPGVSPSVIAPPPDISEVLPSRQLTPATTPVVIEPTPIVQQSTRQAASINIGQLHVVGPVPEMPLHQQLSFPVRGTLIESTSVVPPPPSIGGLGDTGQRTSSPGYDVPIVPPAPSLQSASMQSTSNYSSGNSDGIAVPVVPPPPSTYSLDVSDGQRVGLVIAAGMQIARVSAAIHPPSAPSRSGGPTMLTSRPPSRLLPGETVPNHDRTLTDTKELPDTRELSVNSMVPALVLPTSSYFSNSEVFIAEQRLAQHQSRLIKLIYEFLPYQPRLSDYGPNYPAIEKLRATRDRSCDQALSQVAASASTVLRSPSGQLQSDAKSIAQRQNTLECYRTTADDYRRARAHQNRPKVATSTPNSNVLPD